MNWIKKCMMPLMAGFTLITMSSCEYKDLEELNFDTESIIVDFSWEKTDSVPSCFRVVLCPADNGTRLKTRQDCLTFDIYNTAAVLNNVPCGNYFVTAYNTDTQKNLVKNNHSLYSMISTLTDDDVRKTIPYNVIDSIYDGQRIYDTPDFMMHHTAEKFTVRSGMQNLLTLVPDSMVTTVRLKIYGIKGLQYARQIVGTVNNASAQRWIAEDNKTDEASVVMFECHYNDETIYSDFYVYGLFPDHQKNLPHKLTLFFWLDGQNIYIPLDISDQIEQYDEGDRIIDLNITDINLNLKEKIVGKGMFDIHVSEWSDSEENIIIVI